MRAMPYAILSIHSGKHDTLQHGLIISWVYVRLELCTFDPMFSKLVERLQIQRLFVCLALRATLYKNMLTRANYYIHPRRCCDVTRRHSHFARYTEKQVYDFRQSFELLINDKLRLFCSSLMNEYQHSEGF